MLGQISQNQLIPLPSVAIQNTQQKQYLSNSHYPREKKGGTSFRALPQLHKWCVECSFIRGIHHVEQAQDSHWYSYSWPIHCCDQRLRKIYEVRYKFPAKHLRYKNDEKKGREIWILSLQLRKESQKNLKKPGLMNAFFTDL